MTRLGRGGRSPALAILMAMAMLAACGPNVSSAHLTVAGYVVPWDIRSMVTDGQHILVEASPQWYVPTTQGQVTFLSGVDAQAVSNTEAEAFSRHVALLPSIDNFTGSWNDELIVHILHNPSTRAAHISAITRLVETHHWEGIDIDYESLPASARSDFSAFIADLARALHAHHARLSVTVHAKTAEPGDWSGAQAQDWRALGQAADEVRIMAYDYSTLADPPGPIAPVTWVEQVLTLATREVSRQKIMLGLPTYGYDWTDGHQATEQEANTQDLQWEDIMALAQAHHATENWDTKSASPWFTYTDAQGQRHTVWFENARSLQVKLTLASNAGVGGVFLWRLGGVDPAIWPPLAQAAGRKASK